MVGRLRRVVMRRPGEAMAAADPAAWHYTSAIDVEEARRAHDAFADALRAWDVEVLYHDEPLPDHSDSVFVFDPRPRHRPGDARAQHGQGAPARRGGASRAHAAGLRRAGLRPPGGRRPRRGRRHPVAGPRHAGGGPRLPDERRRRASAPRPARARRRHRPRLRPAVLHRPGRVSSPAQPDQPGRRRPGRRLPAAHAHRLLGGAPAPRRPAARGPGGGVRADAGDQHPHRRSAQVHHAGRKPGDAGGCSRWPAARS